MKKVLSLVLLMLILMSSLVSCYIPIREANINDIYYEFEDDLGSALGAIFMGKLTLNLQVQEKIKGLVLEINFKTDDGEIIGTRTINAGTVVPGNKYTYDLDVTLGMLDAPKYNIKIVSGYVVIP